jgi:hypothetical protein
LCAVYPDLKKKQELLISLVPDVSVDDQELQEPVNLFKSPKDRINPDNPVKPQRDYPVDSSDDDEDLFEDPLEEITVTKPVRINR